MKTIDPKEMVRSTPKNRTGLLVATWVTSVAAAVALVTWPALGAGSGSQASNEPEPGQQQVRTLDDLFADVAAKYPPFGGAFVDEEKERLYVYCKDPSPDAVEKVEAALKVVFGTDVPPYSSIEVLKGDYNFAELKNWHDRLSTISMPGLVLTDIDDSTNRLKVGVSLVMKADGKTPFVRSR